MGEAELMDDEQGGFPAREHFLDGAGSGDDPLRQARADKIRAEYESTTVSGLSQLLARTVAQMTATHQAEVAAINDRWKAHEAGLYERLISREAELTERLRAREAELLALNERLHQRLTEGIGTTYQSFTDLATLPAIVAEHGKQLLEAQSEHLTKMRQPLEPRPSGSETAGDVAKHLFTQLREVAGDVFSSNPELRKRAQRLLGGAIERGETILAAGGGAPGSPGPAEGPAEPVPEEARIDRMPLKEVFDLFQALPSEVISRFATDLGLKEPFEATWLQMRQLLAAHLARAPK